MSASKEIKLKKQEPINAKEISEAYKLSDLSARILAARGFCVGSKLEQFLKPSLKDGLPNPKELHSLKDAVELLAGVIKKGGRIAIASDFDVDGLSSASQLIDFLNRLNAKVTLFVPDRFKEGYGLNQRIVNDAKKFGCEVLLCLDFGTHNQEELNFARSVGLKTVVIDHHLLDEAGCPADVFINPQKTECGFAEKTLCTAGLVWYLIIGLRAAIPEASEIDTRNYLDLAALGTICDMAPLTGTNRVITVRGLHELSKTTRPGILALKEVSGVKSDVSCYDVGFLLGPRINAAGRMVSGEIVAELLTTRDTATAIKIANTLNRLNYQRQEEELKVRSKAFTEIEKLKELPYGIVLWGEEYHTGVVGIVAQRLVEKFHRPAIVLGLDSEDIYKGSVRGIKGVNVVEALSNSKELLIKFGGHESAGGLSIKKQNLEKFAEKFSEQCKKLLSEKALIPMVDCDTEAELSELSVSAINEIKELAPFGIGNPHPTVLVRGVTVTTIKSLKNEHLKVQVTDRKANLDGIWWRMQSHLNLKIGAKLDLAIKPELNNFNGLTTAQANIQAVRSYQE